MFQTEVNKACDLNIRLGVGIGIFQGLSNLVTHGIILSTIAVGGQYVYQNRLFAGDLMAFLVATQTIQRSLTQMSTLIGQAIRGLSAGARIHEYQKLTNCISLEQGIRIPYHSMFGEVQFSNISFAYPTREQQVKLIDNLKLIKLHSLIFFLFFFFFSLHRWYWKILILQFQVVKLWLSLVHLDQVIRKRIEETYVELQKFDFNPILHKDSRNIKSDKDFVLIDQK